MIIYILIILIIIITIFYSFNKFIEEFKFKKDKELFTEVNTMNLFEQNVYKEPFTEVNTMNLFEQNVDVDKELSTPFPIDIVYTWKGEKITNNIRDSYNYELKYSLRSIDLYAPWVNKIYILVDAPKKYPSWIDSSNKKIVIVDTTETFQNLKYLPNSNSNAIETTIINIPNLSEHYIYLCDDIFLGREAKYTDFFTIDGKALVDYYCKINNSMLINDNINLLNIKLPPTVNKFYPHIPIPQLKSVVKDFYNEYYDYIEWIRNTKNRIGIGCNICSEYKLYCPCQQIHYPICKYMYLRNKAILIDNRNRTIFIMNNSIYLNNSNKTVFDKIMYEKPLFFCINDDEKNPQKRIIVRNYMLNFFINYYPEKASFEL